MDTSNRMDEVSAKSPSFSHPILTSPSFMGSNSFCLKACDPSGANAAEYCQHIYDRIGCAYNAPNNAQDLVFESCDADNADFPGVYTDTSGAVVTYTQPAESLGAITTMPYTATVPASSNCVTYTSSALFTDLAAVTASASGSAATSGSTAKASSTSTVKSSQTGTSASASSTASSGADAVVVSGAASLMGVIFAGLFLA